MVFVLDLAASHTREYTRGGPVMTGKVALTPANFVSSTHTPQLASVTQRSDTLILVLSLGLLSPGPRRRGGGGRCWSDTPVRRDLCTPGGILGVPDRLGMTRALGSDVFPGDKSRKKHSETGSSSFHRAGLGQGKGQSKGQGKGQGYTEHVRSTVVLTKIE